MKSNEQGSQRLKRAANKSSVVKLNQPYTTRTIKINARSIKKFVRPEWHRVYRHHHVTRIAKAYLEGVHPSEPITVNEKRSKYTILNGNHRIKALLEVLKVRPEFTIDMTLIVYRDLSLDQQKTLYSVINAVTPENAHDRLKAEMYKTEILDLFETQPFPFNLKFRNITKSERNVMTMSMLLLPYIGRNHPSFSFTVRHAVSTGVIKTLGLEDFKRMRSFAKSLVEIIGEPNRNNLFACYNIVAPLAKIFYTNVGTTLTREQFIKQAKRVIATQHTIITSFKSGGARITVMAYDFFLQNMRWRGKPLYDTRKKKK